MKEKLKQINPLKIKHTKIRPVNRDGTNDYRVEVSLNDISVGIVVTGKYLSSVKDMELVNNMLAGHLEKAIVEKFLKSKHLDGTIYSPLVDKDEEITIKSVMRLIER